MTLPADFEVTNAAAEVLARTPIIARCNKDNGDVTINASLSGALTGVTIANIQAHTADGGVVGTCSSLVACTITAKTTAAQCASGYSVYLSMELTAGTSTLQVHSAFVTASIQTP